MSTQRSNSSVRDLRAVFEGIDPNVERPSSTTSDRASIGDGERVSKIRASFVSVERPDFARTRSRSTGITTMSEPANTMKEMEEEGIAEVGTADSSMLEGKANGVDSGAGADSRIDSATVAEVTESATVEADTKVNGTADAPTEPKIASPAKGSSGSQTNSSQEPVNPDKPTTGAEEEPGALQPAEPTTASTIAAAPSLNGTSNGHVPKPDSPKASKSTPSKSPTQVSKPPTKNVRPPSLSKTADSPRVSSIYSPRRPTTSDSKSSEMSAGTPTRSAFTTKTGRSSLTAQTAASAARAKNAISDATASSVSVKEQAVRKGPKSPTRPVRLSAHLTAPTASFAAKHENIKPTTAATSKTTTTRSSASLSKPTASSTSRSSMGAAARTSAANKSSGERTLPIRKPAPKTVAADDSFLARMTRPTASSANRAQAHEKAEAKPASKASALSRTHGGASAKVKPTTSKPKTGTSKTKEVAAPAVNGTKAETVETAETAAPATPTTNGKANGSGDDSIVLDSYMAAIPTPALAEPTIR